MKTPNYRYILFGTIDGLDYIIGSNVKKPLLKEGLLRLKLGYSATMYDKKKNLQFNLKLKSKQ